MNPRTAALALERSRRHGGADPSAENMAGYGLLGLTFASGHTIGFRRFTASSIGPPYLSIWHRQPDARWIIHTNVEPDRACPRYFGPALDSYHVDDIEIAWNGPAELSITAVRARLHLALRLEATPLTRALSAAVRLVPDRLLALPAFGAAAGRLLDAGRVSLRGRTPSGHSYLIRPHGLWRVAAAAAVLDGRDAGGLAVLPTQVALGDFMIPARGLFAAGRVAFSTAGCAGGRAARPKRSAPRACGGGRRSGAWQLTWHDSAP